MAVTHFEVTRLPEDHIISLMGADPLEVGVRYPIARESEISLQRIPSLDGFYVSDRLSYKAYDEVLGKYGNVSDIQTTWRETDISILPAGTDLTETLVNGQEVGLLDKFGINGATEFVEILSMTGATAAKLNGQTIIPGQRLSPSELLKSKLIILQSGGGNPYFTLTYKAGRGDVLEDTVYTYVVNVDTMAALLISSQESRTEVRTDGSGFDTEWVIEESTVSVVNGPSMGSATLSITVNAPFLDTVGNTMRITSNGYDEHFAVASETFHLESLLTKIGRGSVNITTNIKNDAPGTYVGSVALTLIAVSGNGPISPDNYTVTVNTNL